MNLASAEKRLLAHALGTELARWPRDDPGYSDLTWAFDQGELDSLDLGDIARDLLACMEVVRAGLDDGVEPPRGVWYSVAEIIGDVFQRAITTQAEESRFALLIFGWHVSCGLASLGAGDIDDIPGSVEGERWARPLPLLQPLSRG